ncbi:hypothetical protein LEMLEM_LOCUS25833, partial [Lemmus lemmus]
GPQAHLPPQLPEAAGGAPPGQVGARPGGATQASSEVDFHRSVPSTQCSDLDLWLLSMSPTSCLKM